MKEFISFSSSSLLLGYADVKLEDIRQANLPSKNEVIIGFWYGGIKLSMEEA